MARRRHERLRVLGVHAALDRVAVEGDLSLPERQPLARRDANLLFHDVDAGHELGDRMLDLEACVRLHEIELCLLVHQELERPRVGVLHGPRGVDDEIAQLAALFFRQRRRRRLLEQLLMAALNGAFALAQMHDRAVMIAQHLHLDVPGVLEVLLDVDVGHAECRLGLPLGGLDGVAEFLRRAHDAHAASAAAGGRLHDHGKPSRRSQTCSASSSFSTGPSVPGRSGRPAFFMARRARALSPISRITLGSGPMNRM